MSEEVKTPSTKSRGSRKQNKKVVPEQEPKTETPVTEKESVKETKPKTETPVTKKEPEPKTDVTTLDKDSIPYIEKIINDAKTVEDIFVLKDSEPVSSIINKLETYRTRMIGKHTEIEGMNQQYLMYNTLMEILNERNYGLFAIKFKLVNKLFTVGKDGVFSKINMSRYDYHWKYGVKTHETYFKLVSIVTTLCDGRTRDKNAKTIDFNNGIDNLSSEAKQNLIRFYK